MTLKNNPYLFMLFPITAVLGGIIGYNQYNIFNATLIFEIWFLFFIINNLSLKKNRALISSIIFLYIFISFLIANPLSANNLTSFIVIYKAFFYLAMLLLLKQNIITAYDIRIDLLLNIIFYAFFIKYSVFFLLNIAEGKIPRPGLFTENNFELAFLICLIILKVKLYEKLTKKDYFLIITIFILSFSKSGILSLIMTLAFLNLKLNKKILMTLSSLLLIIYLFFITIESRHQSLENIDRFIFLLIYTEEIKQFSFTNFLIGMPAITPLASSTCQQIMFSDYLLEKDGNCYSTVFHSYWLRLIFDHGLIGLIIILSVLYYAIKSQPIRIKLAILALVFTNGLSVSSINSVYLVFGIALLLSIVKLKPSK